jgi:DNA-binding transcriptional ArsR family regulator
MGLTKTELFTEEQNKIAAIAKVLGHPARVAILQHLLKVNACICGEIVEVVGLSQPTISQHLKELKNIGLIIGNIEGTSICYCINPKTYKNINTLFNHLFSQQLSDKENSC